LNPLSLTAKLGPPCSYLCLFEEKQPYYREDGSALFEAFAGDLAPDSFYSIFPKASASDTAALQYFA